jgi:hypothetical protein
MVDEPDDASVMPAPDDGAVTEEPGGDLTIVDLLGGGYLSRNPVQGTAAICGTTFINQSVTYEVIDGRAVFEFDILMGSAKTLEAAGVAATEAAKVAAVSATAVPFGVGVNGVYGSRWPFGQIPFEFQPGIPDSQKTMVTNAISEWQFPRTPIKFVERTVANAYLFPNYVQVVRDTKNYAHPGMHGGRQLLALRSDATTGVAIHELGHTIGLWHEQSRADRDDYVDIHWTNIARDNWHNFYQHITDGDDTGLYDYGSIMHYARNVAALNPAKDSISPTNPSDAQIGQLNGPSAGDIAAVKAIYAPTSGAPVKKLVLPSAFDRAETAWIEGFDFVELEPSFGYAGGGGTGNFVYHFQLPEYAQERRFAGISAVICSGREGQESDVSLIVNTHPQATYRVQARSPSSNGVRYLWVLPEEALHPGQDNTIEFAVRGGAVMPNGISIFQRTFSTVPEVSIEVAVPYILPDEPIQEAYAAEFIPPQQVPTFMIAGTTHEVSVKMYNPNTRVWRYGKVFLRSEEPPDNMRWNINRVDLPGSTDVPGHSDALFKFSVTAPQQLGLTSFRWRMAAENYGPFGQRNAPVWVMVAKDALFVRQTVPATMVGGTIADAKVTFRNIGNVTWTKATNFKLGSQSPQDNDRWGLHRVQLPDNVQVPPGAEHTFEFSIKAPTTVGKAVFQWQMLQEGVRWLGAPSDPFEIRVMPVLITEANKGPQIVHTPIHPGSIQMVAVTMKNVGTDTWTAAGQYMLGSWEPADNLRWGINRVPLPHDVPPNTEVTFTFGITARDALVTSNFQWRMIKGAEWFGQANDPVAVTVASMQDPSLGVYFVKNRNVGQGRVEAFRMSRSLGYGRLETALPTRFSSVDSDNCWFGMHRNGNIYCVKARNTPSGRAEVFTATHASQYVTPIFGDSASRFAVDSAGDGRFGILPNGDLYFIKTRNTGTGTIEVHTALSPTFAHGLSIGTRFSALEAANGLFGMLPNNDLYFIKTKNTAAGKVEAFSASSGSWYQNGIASPTRFTVAEAESGVLGMLSNGDVYFVKLRNTVSGMVEVSTATRASNYTSGNPLARCYFTTAEGPNGTWGMV